MEKLVLDMHLKKETDGSYLYAIPATEADRRCTNVYLKKYTFGDAAPPSTVRVTIELPPTRAKRGA